MVAPTTTRYPKFCSQALIRVQITEEAKKQNFYRAYHLSYGLDKRYLIHTLDTTTSGNCKVLCNMCDCTMAENPNKTELINALDNAALEK